MVWPPNFPASWVRLVIVNARRRIATLLGAVPATIAVSCAMPAGPKPESPRPSTNLVPRSQATSPADLTGAAADSDHDGIPDSRDRCPLEPETYNGCNDDDGCPDKLVHTPPGWPATMLPIYFEAGRSEVPPSFYNGLNELDALASIIKRRPEWGVIEVQGHAAADERSPDALAESRASEVERLLIARGVPSERLIHHGYGTRFAMCVERETPCPPKDERVEFKVLQPPPLPPKAPGDCWSTLL